MNCLKCGTRLSCVDSRCTEKNTTWRRLSCPKCKEVYHSTEEVVLTGKQERSLARSQSRAQAKEKAKEKESYEQYKQQIIDETLKAMAEASIARNVYTSYITGGVYSSEEEAISDTLSELKRIYEESTN